MNKKKYGEEKKTNHNHTIYEVRGTQWRFARRPAD